MNSPTNHHSVYVVLLNGAQKNRTQALRTLAGDSVTVTYVSRSQLDVSPVECLLVRPRRNPLAVLGLLRLRRLQALLERYIYFPTKSRLWVGPAVRLLDERIKHDLEAGSQVTVMTVSAPQDVPLVGMRLKQKHPAIRWVNDWQDYWTFDNTYFDRHPGLLRGRVRRTERKLFSRADANVVLNESAMDHVTTHCGADVASTLPIGHHIADVDAAIGAAGWEPPAEPRIAHMGGMFKPPKVNGERFVEALRSLRIDGRTTATLHLFGPPRSEAAPYLADAASGLVAEDMIATEDVVTTLREHSFSLLLLEPSPSAVITMHLKLPEYVVAGPPILAVVPAWSNPARIVTETGTGFVLDPDDPGWIERLARILGGEEAAPSRNDEAIGGYSWDNVRPRWIEALGLPTG